MRISRISSCLRGIVLGGVMLAFACENPKEHTAAAVRERDSLPMMVSYGVNTLMSDSGVIKYRLIAESYEINQVKDPSRWTFDKGLLLQEFDEKFHVQLYIQCDTAYYYDKLKLWELRGRVRVLTKDGLRFYSEELFRDENKRELYSNMYSRLVTPDRELQGRYFRSDERMTRYYVSNSKGAFERKDVAGGEDTLQSVPDTTKQMIRPSAAPQRKSIYSAQP